MDRGYKGVHDYNNGVRDFLFNEGVDNGQRAAHRVKLFKTICLWQDTKVGHSSMFLVIYSLL